MDIKDNEPDSQDQKPKVNRALGHDPFADMDDLELTAADTPSGSPMLFPAPIPPESFQPPAPVADPPSVLPQPETLSTPVLEPEPELPIEPEPMFEPLPEVEETPANAGEPQAKAQVELKEEAVEVSGMLDDLVATLDEEIAQTLGSDLMDAFGTEKPTDQRGNSEQYVIFTLAGTEYAAPIGNIIEIGQSPTITPVPHVPNWVLGVTNLRGDVLSVVDLRSFLGLANRDVTATDQILIAQIDQGVDPLLVGLIVDRVNEIRYLSQEYIAKPAAPLADQITPYLQGVYEYESRLLVVLDVEHLLLSTRMQQFETI